VDTPGPDRFVDRSTGSVDAAGFGTVIYAGGFRPDFGSLVRVAGTCDEHGFPIHDDGQSTVLPGLFYVGVHFLRKRKSSILYGVAEDAAIVARQVAARARS
jgi:thioredoxin reductase